jgi:CheY-like chemotaxis protein/anti-sigma regulatory factor (Ser/Thr protein kinase)
VKAVADILQRKLSDETLTPYVRTIQDSGETLLRLLTDALDLSRADAGRLELTEDSFHVPGLLGDLACLWRPRAELKGLATAFTYQGDQALWALGDAVRIKQVFNNLIGNALKFTAAGEVVVRLEAVGDADGYVWLTGEVADTGVGVPPDRLTSIFEPFSQTEAGRREGGAGLGLAVCRQLVEQMDGTIEADARPDGGAVFRFHMPLFETPAPEAVVAERDEGAAVRGGLHILIADDNATNRLVAETLCDLMGCSSECVEDGAQAVEAARSRRFDLILMDVKMPNMDGLEATARIRDLAGDAGRTPILALTANADPWDAQSYLAQGMDGVIEKPIKIERFMEAVAGLFGEDDAKAVAA